VESTTAGKSKGIIKAATAAAVILCLLVVWAYTRLHTAPLSSLVKKDLPMLKLNLRFVNINGKEIPTDQTRLATRTTRLEKSAGTGTLSCPEIQGGDIHNGSEIKSKEKIPKDCPRQAIWYIKRHPIGVSLSIADPQRVQRFMETDKTFLALWQSRFLQGVFYDPLRNVRIRAEDLGVQGLEGAFLDRLAKESMAAHARLDYDALHGKKGFVYSFVRGECPYAAKVLPVIARVLARSGYITAQLKEPILEMNLGLQRLFLTEQGARVYVANGLEALLNVIENERGGEMDTVSAPLVLTVEADAFLDKFFQVMSGDSSFRMRLGFVLDPQSADYVSFPAGKYAGHLRPKIFKGVLAGIPHDVFSAVVTSFYLSPDMITEQWHDLATNGPADGQVTEPEEGGIALIWDLDSESARITEMGVVIASQIVPEASQKLAAYFTNHERTAECGGGTVFLAATSDMLLTRMKESCERQSLSVLDWERGAHKEAFAAQQFLFFLNPGAGMREVFLAGGAKAREIEMSKVPWREQYEKAKAVMREDGEGLFSTLPILAYSGSARPLAKEVRLNGIHIRPGAAQ
jgi:hypothetical protein